MDPGRALSMALRIALVYFYLLGVIRLAGKRVISEGTPFDFLVALIVADMPDDVIWGEVPVAQGLTAMGSIMLLHGLVAYLCYRSPRLRRLIASMPRAVIQSGAPVPRGQVLERISDAELGAMLRDHEVDLQDVRLALLEPEGKLSVRRHDDARTATRADLLEGERKPLSQG